MPLIDNFTDKFSR